MKRLFVLDRKDYDESWPRHKRPSVRAIILAGDGKLSMVHIARHDYYTFPGGGIEPGETLHQALIREAEEESGLRVIPESIEDFGAVLRLSSIASRKNTVFEQENYYYTCRAYDEPGVQRLEADELEAGYTLAFVTPEEALRKNRSGDHGDANGAVWIEREAKVLEAFIAAGNSKN